MRFVEWFWFFLFDFPSGFARCGNHTHWLFLLFFMDMLSDEVLLENAGKDA